MTASTPALSTAHSVSMNATDTFVSDLLGPVTYAGDQLLTFNEGIPGFANCHRWILIQGEKRDTAWLQSLDVSGLTFFLVDPFVFFDGFALDLPPGEVKRLDAEDASHLAVFAIVTFPASRDEQATANLQGPVVINVAHRRAAQVILSEGPWTVRHPFRLHSPSESA